MKKLDEMLNAPRVVVGKRIPGRGFTGEIHMPKWTGTLIVSWDYGWEHVSVCPLKRKITPSWDDMCYIKDLFWREDEAVVQIHPEKAEYVNNMPNCLHLWKPAGKEMPLPPSILVGIRKGMSRKDIERELAKLEGGSDD